MLIQQLLAIANQRTTNQRDQASLRASIRLREAYSFILKTPLIIPLRTSTVDIPLPDCRPSNKRGVDGAAEQRPRLSNSATLSPIPSTTRTRAQPSPSRHIPSTTVADVVYGWEDKYIDAERKPTGGSIHNRDSRPVLGVCVTSYLKVGSGALEHQFVFEPQMGKKQLTPFSSSSSDSYGYVGQNFDETDRFMDFKTLIWNARGIEGWRANSVINTLGFDNHFKVDPIGYAGGLSLKSSLSLTLSQVTYHFYRRSSASPSSIFTHSTFIIYLTHSILHFHRRCRGGSSPVPWRFIAGVVLFFLARSVAYTIDLRMAEGVQSSAMESNQGPTAPSLTPVEETQETSPEQIGTMPSSEAPNEVSHADTEAEKPSSPNKRGLTSQAWTHFKRFIYVPAPHNAEVLCNVLVECLLDWNLDRKISTLTLDNCTTNDAMDGLSTIYDSIEKIRQSVAYWVATPKREEKFEETCRQLGSLKRLKQRESQYKCLPSDEDWTMASEIGEKLEIFYMVTKLFSGTQYPTSNVYFPKVCQIKLTLQEWLSSPRDTIRSMATTMLAKFDKYWSTINGVMAIGAILDPRYKMTLLNYYFPFMYGDNYSSELERVKQLCADLVAEYQSKEKNSVMTLSDSATSTLTDVSSLPKQTKWDSGYFRFVKESACSTNVKSELDYYLEETVLLSAENQDKYDILAYWKMIGAKYPTLQKIARDFLAIPISTVASESAFSTGGRVLSPHRSRLNPNTVEALMCSQDWLGIELLACLNSTNAGMFTEDTDPIDEASSI
ncbi:zinc finger BED domain-containing protein RICESLEEPER 2-like [Senna tora]|uniref:Zinc finger BED domain-containing protein RICESLEEPER 2-like n=1 Tax=Senna tora TaxID=362788 RepID=A0A834THI9_9FABA|nr:zinc finger BED domain-containing protein RICESLEEPER 2-like [Senna tora]